MDLLNIETKRLETFDNWKISFIDKNQLALFGFYYCGPGDLVKCNFCQIEIGLWEEGDDVLTDHMRWSRHCKLICRAVTNNIPINEALLLESLPPTPSPDVYGHLSGVSLDMEDPNGLNDVGGTSRSVDEMNNSKYAIEANRLKSYKNWPVSIQQRPHQLSDAGFYYTNVGDRVCCYYCGGGLKDWEEDDDPWENHAMWYGNCKYVNLMKGEKFIQKMSQKRELLSKSSNVRPKSAGCVKGLRPSAVRVEQIEKINEIEKKLNESEEINVNKKCKICFENDYNTVFIPCGHIIACAKCSLSITKCPACRQPFERVINVFFS